MGQTPIFTPRGVSASGPCGGKRSTHAELFLSSQYHLRRQNSHWSDVFAGRDACSRSVTCVSRTPIGQIHLLPAGSPLRDPMSSQCHLRGQNTQRANTYTGRDTAIVPAVSLAIAQTQCVAYLNMGDLLPQAGIWRCIFE